MTLSLIDKFEDSQGRINTSSITPTWEPDRAHLGTTAFLNAVDQRHVDLLSFFHQRYTPVSLTTLEETPLSGLQGDTVGSLSSTLSSALLSELSLPFSATGAYGVMGLPQAAYSNWQGVRFWVTDGSAQFDINTLTPEEIMVDISTMDKLVLTVPSTAVNSGTYFNLANCTITLGTGPYANLANTPTVYRSAVVPFSAAVSSTLHSITFNLSQFASGAGSAYDPTRVSSVNIHLEAPSTNLGDSICVMELRAIDSSWTYWQNDVSTALNSLVFPSSQHGDAVHDLTGATAAVPIMRGSIGAAPEPLDGTVGVIFNAGHSGSVHRPLTTAISSTESDSDLYNAPAMSGYSYTTGYGGRAVSNASLLVPTAAGLTAPSASGQYEIRDPLGGGEYTAYDRRQIRFTPQALGASPSDPVLVGFTHVGTFGNQEPTWGDANSTSGIHAWLEDNGSVTKVRAELYSKSYGGNFIAEGTMSGRLTPGTTYWLESTLSYFSQTVKLYTSDPSVNPSATAVATASISWMTATALHLEAISDLIDASVAGVFYTTTPSMICYRPRSTTATLSDYKVMKVSKSTDKCQLGLYFRERQDSNGKNQWQRAILEWTPSSVRMGVEVNNDTSGSTLAYSQYVTMNLPLDGADPYDLAAGRYKFSASVTASTVDLELRRVDGADRVGEIIKTARFTSAQLTEVTGRVGMYADFTGFKDAYVDAFIGTGSSYGYITYKPSLYRRPVDGARLTADYSQDQNLYKSVTYLDQNEDAILLPDSQSGLGSYPTVHGLRTNSFLVEDWRHMYVDLNIHTGTQVTSDTQPILSMVSKNGEAVLPIPLLLPDSWNRVRLGLEGFVGNETGIMYALILRPPSNTTSPNKFSVDANIGIYRRLVDWQLRAKPDAVFRSFRGMVNDPNGALRLGHDERGTSVQLQVVSLSPDAWVGESILEPHIAQHGNFVFDEAYSTH